MGNLEFADKLVPTINECIAKKTNEMEIRVTAVEAFRRMSCGADVSNYEKKSLNSDGQQFHQYQQNKQ
jgi:hypothetical protein